MELFCRTLLLVFELAFINDARTLDTEADRLTAVARLVQDLEVRTLLKPQRTMRRKAATSAFVGFGLLFVLEVLAPLLGSLHEFFAADIRHNDV